MINANEKVPAQRASGDISTNSCRLPRVAVLLAAYNGKRWLEVQIKSILEQEDIAVTVFVSVDVSADGTEELANGLASLHSRIVVLPCGERFGGAARNFFRLLRDVEFEDFDYISFSDQDDVWLRNKLSRAHEFLQEQRADAYSSNVMAFWPSGRRSLVRKSQSLKRWDFLFEAAGPGCTYVMTVRLATDIKARLRERWEEAQAVGLHDWFSYAFARANGYQWVIDEYAGVLYRQHERNQVGVNSGVRAFVHRARKVLSGWGLEQAALIAELVGLGKEPFVTRWSNGRMTGVIWLATRNRECRRRLRDQIVFAISCVLLAIVGKRQS